MAVISPTEIKGLGNVILHPKLCNRFKVLFARDGEIVLEDLSMQVLAFSGLPSARRVIERNDSAESVTFELDPGVVEDERSEFIISFEDDVSSKTVMGIYALLGKRFTIAVQLLDSNDRVTEEYSFNGAHLGDYFSDDLDYRGRSTERNGVQLKLGFPSYLANKKLTDDELKLQAFLSGMTLTGTTSSADLSAALTKTCSFSYTQVYHTIFSHT